MRIVFIFLSVVVLLALYRWAAPEAGGPASEQAPTEKFTQALEQGAEQEPSVLAEAAPKPDKGSERAVENRVESTAENAQPVYYLQFLDGAISSARLSAADAAPGELTSGVAVLDLRGGQTLLLRVLSDKKEELHLHGYDVHLHLKPGEEGRLELYLKHTGRFELELHGAHRQLAVLEVRPAA